MIDRTTAERLMSDVRDLRVAGDTDGIMALFGDGATFRIVGSATGWPFGEAVAGKDAIRAALADITERFEFLEYRAIKTLIDGDAAAVRCVAKVRHRSSGKVAETETSDFFTFEDGKCSSFTQYADTALAMEIAGG